MRKQDEERLEALERMASCRHAELGVQARWVPDTPFKSIRGIHRAHWVGSVICSDCGATWPATSVVVDMKQEG